MMFPALTAIELRLSEMVLLKLYSEKKLKFPIFNFCMRLGRDDHSQGFRDEKCLGMTVGNQIMVHEVGASKILPTYTPTLQKPM